MTQCAKSYIRFNHYPQIKRIKYKRLVTPILPISEKTNKVASIRIFGYLTFGGRPGTSAASHEPWGKPAILLSWTRWASQASHSLASLPTRFVSPRLASWPSLHIIKISIESQWIFVEIPLFRILRYLSVINLWSLKSDYMKKEKKKKKIKKEKKNQHF